MSNIVLIYCGSSFTKSLYDNLKQLDITPWMVCHDTSITDIMKVNPLGIIITGSGYSIQHPKAPRIDQNIYTEGVPVLGICYGMQLMAHDLGGKVKRMTLPEKGLSILQKDNPSVLYRDFEEDVPVWMSHVCRVTDMPPEFTRTGSTDESSIASMENKERDLYALQYHPEHIGKDASSQAGTAILWNFLNGVCGHIV